MKTFRFVVFFMSVLVLHVAENVHEMQIKTTKDNFSWKNCNTTAVPMWVKSLSVAPDPITVGSDLIISTEIELFSEVDKIAADVSIMYIEDGQGYEMCDMINLCKIPDICGNLTNFFPKSQPDKCPSMVRKEHSNCRCPFKKNSYGFQKLHFPSTQIPTEGTFNITLNLMSHGKPLGCFQTHLCVKECS